MTGPNCAICGDPIFRQKSAHGVPFGRWYHLTRNPDRVHHRAVAPKEVEA